jgi:VWFA-related protein
MQATPLRLARNPCSLEAIVRALCAVSAIVAAGPALEAQSQAPAEPGPKTPVEQNQPTVIRRTFNLVRADVIVRDSRGRFIADLKKDDFEVYEDGVRQDVITFAPTIGGRTYNADAATRPSSEGIILPSGPPANTASRIFIIFIDDLHLDFENTGRIRALFHQISEELIHDGDMFAVLSTGTSSIEIDPTYDRKRLAEAENKIAGGGLKPNEILEAPLGAAGVAEVNHRAHVAFSSANDMLRQLEPIHDRRKAFIYLSNGYDLNPFRTTREKNDKDRANALRQPGGSDGGTGDGSNDSRAYTDPFGQNKGNQFTEADLVSQLSEVTRQANRANATIYAIDSRGLAGMAPMDQKVDMSEWNAHLTATQNTLRTLSDLTGGFAIVNRNDFTDGLKRIDAETSDYYFLGYYSSNPDPLKWRRKIEIRVKRPNANLFYRQEYTLKPTRK